MKMVMAVIPRDEAEDVLHALINAGHTATFTESRGGMLRQAQKTLFIAVRARDLPKILDIICSSCRSPAHVEFAELGRDSLSPHSKSVKTALGGAVVFVWDLERFETY
jgi:uncharacterized protein YaaQ